MAYAGSEDEGAVLRVRFVLILAVSRPDALTTSAAAVRRLLLRRAAVVVATAATTATTTATTATTATAATTATPVVVVINIPGRDEAEALFLRMMSLENNVGPLARGSTPADRSLSGAARRTQRRVLTRRNGYAATSSTVQGARVLWVKVAPPTLGEPLLSHKGWVSLSYSGPVSMRPLS